MANHPMKNEDRGVTTGQQHEESSTAGQLMDKARETAATVGRKAEGAAGTVGSGMKSLAGTVRERGPHEGMLGSASTSVAGALETGGRYLQEEGFSGLMSDVTGVIRRNPLPAVLIGFGLGFLLARTTTSRS